MSSNEIVQAVLDLAHQSVKQAHREKLTSFLECYCAELPGDFLRSTDPHRLFAFGMERFAFMEDGFCAGVKVSISAPSETLGELAHNASVIEARLPDCTFIVRTFKAFCHSRGIQVRMAVHPVMGVIHSGGQISEIDPTARHGAKTSHIYLLVSQLPEEDWGVYEDALDSRLKTLLRVNEDYKPSLDKLAEVRLELEALCNNQPALAVRGEEAIQLLDWVGDNHFIFMGYAFVPAPGQDSQAASRPALGVLANPERELSDVIRLVAQGRLSTEEVYSFYRTDYKSVVKSEAQLRYVGFKAYDGAGGVLGEHVFIGLLSSIGLAEPNKRIPIIAQRMTAMLDSLNLLPGTYSFKKVFAILNSIPNEDLFYYSLDEMIDRVRVLREAEESDHTRVFIHRRPGMRRISTICIMPRGRFSEALKARVSQQICQFLEVPHLREYVCESEEEGSIRMHFYVSRYKETVTDELLGELEEMVARLLETWEEKLQRLLYSRYATRPDVSGQTRYLAITTSSGPELWARYADCFSEAYKRTQSPEVALSDIAMMEKLDTDGEVQVSMMMVGEADKRYAALRIVSRRGLLLNDVVPVLQHMMLRTRSRLSATYHPRGVSPAYLTSFEVKGAAGDLIEDPDDLQRLADVLCRVLLRTIGDDPLLGLGSLCGLDGRQIDLMMTYRNYFLQVFRAYAKASVDEALLRHQECARLVVQYFAARFSTQEVGDAAQRVVVRLPDIEQTYEDRLDEVSVIQEDVILRLFFSLVKNTIRTNYYGAGDREVIAVKIDSQRVEHMPRPCPLYEIYVHGPNVEGIHLRGGKVARGGIRHSDRVDDFRTEVLGLMKAQMAKNSVIVPVGSKGGFITRRQFSNRDEMDAEVRLQYTCFIGGLLDVTDNLDGDTLVPPPGVLRYDQDDPYLVVAADKGTARLSDTANAVSQQYKFWLDDAFASGGSAGYDHKAMGITARGAWVNVERHFRELGVNILEESIRVAGIGDMGGDVFGNGMLLNDKIKLVAAFNHRHIFIDPDPDPATSYAERKRLFELPRSAWSDYDLKLLSKGGAVYERAAKRIELSPEVGELFGLNEGPINGPTLINKLLQLDLDLLWFGGIGTYIKASSETDVDVGDRVNDPVRVNADQVRARVIGEGANLGVTARGRTEYYLSGGRCNTDALDNSAGVDCSDHEVNLKILMALLRKAGEIQDRDERNAVLKEIEEDVGRACLENNYLQSALVTMEEVRSRADLGPFLDLLAYLEERGLDRQSEFIPPDDVLREWHSTGHGLARSVLAVIVAYTKNDLYDKVLASDIPDLSFFRPFLTGYFPEQIVERYDGYLDQHRLKREISSTVVTNALVNQAGSTFLLDLGRESSASLEQLIVRYFICDDLLRGQQLRKDVHGLDNAVSAPDQYEALMELEQAIEQLARWWGWNDKRWSLKTDDVAALRGDFEQTLELLVAGLSGHSRAALTERETTLVVDRGFDEALAGRIARLSLLRNAFEVIAFSRGSGLPIESAVEGLYRLGEMLHLDRVDELLAAQAASNAWERRFQMILEREISELRSKLLRVVYGDGITLDQFASEHCGRIDDIGNSLQWLTQAGHVHHGQIPMFIILDDYKGLLEGRAERMTRRLERRG